MANLMMARLLDNNQETSFHLACKNGIEELAETIIKNSVEDNIDLNAKSINGHTALHLACMGGKTKIVELLIKNSVKFNIDLNAESNNGITAFDYAILFRHNEIAQMFVVCQKNQQHPLPVQIQQRDKDDQDLPPQNKE